jgi:hypothetical protein
MWGEKMVWDEASRKIMGGRGGILKETSSLVEIEFSVVWLRGGDIGVVGEMMTYGILLL